MHWNTFNIFFYHFHHWVRLLTNPLCQMSVRFWSATNSKTWDIKHIRMRLSHTTYSYFCTDLTVCATKKVKIVRAVVQEISMWYYLYRRTNFTFIVLSISWLNIYACQLDNRITRSLCIFRIRCRAIVQILYDNNGEKKNRQ